jgi:hypothetical protein
MRQRIVTRAQELAILSKGSRVRRVEWPPDFDMVGGGLVHADRHVWGCLRLFLPYR